MSQDPFGNLRQWGTVLELLDQAFQNGEAEDCQQGLVRILRYKGNWRLREEVLKKAGHIQKPKQDLVREVLVILEDDNTYYEVRILASSALLQLIEKADQAEELRQEARKVIEKINLTPQPPIFDRAIQSCRECLV